MRICVAAQGETLQAPVETRFGRASKFVIVDTEADTVVAIDNGDNAQAAQGAGVQAVETVVAQNVDVVVSGSIGPKAFATLAAAGVKAVLWANGSVARAVELVESNQLKPTTVANVESHWQ